MFLLPKTKQIINNKKLTDLLIFQRISVSFYFYDTIQFMAELQVFYHPSATISSIISTYSAQYFSYNGITACWNRSFSSGESWVITQPFVSTRCLDIDSLAFHWLLSYHADSWAHSRMISLYSSGSLFQV